jgi:hypothetical protein
MINPEPEASPHGDDEFAPHFEEFVESVWH